MKRLILLCLFAALTAGCVKRPTSVTPSLADDLEALQTDIDALPPFPEPAVQSGSLWTDAGPGAAMARDLTAFRVNDLLTVVVSESSSGTNTSSTDLSRTSEANLSAPYVFGLENLARGLEVNSESDFAGDGQTARSSRLASTVTARVMRVLPNGDLIIAGQKTVMINRERQILTLVGSVRPQDLSSENLIASSSVGDLNVRLWGKGEVDDTVRQGWFMRIMNKIWPF